MSCEAIGAHPDCELPFMSSNVWSTLKIYVVGFLVIQLFLAIAPIPPLFRDSVYFDIPFSIFDLSVTRYSQACMLAVFLVLAIFLFLVFADAIVIVLLINSEDSALFVCPTDVQ